MFSSFFSSVSDLSEKLTMFRRVAMSCVSLTLAALLTMKILKFGL